MLSIEEYAKAYIVACATDSGVVYYDGHAWTDKVHEAVVMRYDDCADLVYGGAYDHALSA